MNTAVDFDNFDDAGNDYDLPDPVHLETVMDGLLDTVAGNEGFNLTKAQIYLFSVLDSNDCLTHAQRRDGNESFFGAISNGVKAVWAFIMRMFKAIGNFFFGVSEDSGSKKVDKCEAAIAKSTQATKAATQHSSAPKTEAQVKHVAHAAMEAVKEAKASPSAEVSSHDVDNLEQVAQEILAENKERSEADRKRVIEQMMVLIPKINSRTRVKITDLLKEIQKTTHEFHIDSDGHGEYDVLEGTSYFKMFTGFRDQLNYASGLSLDGFIPLKDTQHAQSLLAVLKRFLDEEIKKTMKIVSAHKSEMIKMIKELQQKVDNHKGNGLDSASFQNDLKACKVFMSFTTRLAKWLEKITDMMTRVAVDVGRLVAPVNQ